MLDREDVVFGRGSFLSVFILVKAGLVGDEAIYFPVYTTRQILLPVSSATRRAPSFATATPTGRPKTFTEAASAMKPVRKSSAVFEAGRPDSKIKF